MIDTTKFKNKKVLILGLGLNEGGVGSAVFFAKAGAQVRVTDLKSKEILVPSIEKLEEYPQIEYVLGEHKFEDIDWADIIIRNPSLKPNNEYRQYAEKSGKMVETDMGIFLQFVSPKQVIGVTGTKGKSTTASLIYEVIKESGRFIGMDPRLRGDTDGEGKGTLGNDQKTANVILAGNITKSVLKALEEIDEQTLVVLELSSFQLEAWDQHQVSPHIAVITNIYPDHLDYYGSMEEYVKAKRVIAKYQTPQDFLFLKKDDEYLSNKEFLNDLSAKLTFFSTEQLPEDFEPTLPGEHNKLNMAAALGVARALKIPDEETLETMENFTGVDFRLQLVKKINGIKIYNDSAATMPTATIQALATIKSPILIVGGMDKGLPYEELAHEIDRKVKAVYFMDGTATEKLKPMLQHKNIQRSIYQDFDSLLSDLKLEAKAGDTILFSPGATSFNFFQNEFDRGRKFNIALDKIFK